MYDQTTLELLTRQRMQERSAELERDRIAREVAGERTGLRRVTAALLVHWGLRLDRAAGEQALDLRPARATTKGGR